MDNINLTEISDEDLMQELGRRKAERKRLRELQKGNMVCCRNCVYRIFGKTYRNGLLGSNYVCCRRPRRYIEEKYNRRSPNYLQGFIRCSSRFNDNCTLFIHKGSDKGKKIAKSIRAIILTQS